MQAQVAFSGDIGSRDAFCEIFSVLVQHIIHLRETLEFYEMQFLQELSPDAGGCGSSECSGEQMHFELAG